MPGFQLTCKSWEINQKARLLGFVIRGHGCFIFLWHWTVSAKFSCLLEAVVASVHFHCFQYQTQGLSHRKIEQCLPLFGCLQRVRFHTVELCDWCVKMISPTALQKCASALIKRDLSERLRTGLNGWCSLLGVGGAGVVMATD